MERRDPEGKGGTRGKTCFGGDNEDVNRRKQKRKEKGVANTTLHAIKQARLFLRETLNNNTV